MPDAPLISTIVAGLVLAFILGVVANRLKMPPLVGYLLAGIIVGPHSPGFVADTELAFELSEIGVVLLMFGVGLNFSLKDLVSVQAVAIPGAVLRIIAGTAMGVGLGTLMGWPLGAGLIFGLALSVASTVVALKALHDRHLVDSDRGRIAIGWVIVEDIVTVLALVLIPAVASILGGTNAALDDPFVSLAERLFNTHLGTAGVIAVTVVKLAAFLGFMLIVGRRLIPIVLHYTAHTGSRELFRLAVLSIALGVAAGAAYLFGVSLALGAFFAGMILSESQLSQRAAQESLPFRDAFAVLFFVAVGMLFDPAILITDPLPVLATLFIIIIGKSVVGFLTVIAVKRPVGTALTVSAALAQIGEFSFILATLGLSLGLISHEAQDLIVAGAILSIILNPIIFWAAEYLRPSLEARFRMTGDDERREPDLDAPPAEVQPVEPVVEAPAPVQPTTLSGHIVLIGFGRVGSVVGRGLFEARRPFLVIDDAEDQVAAARALGVEVIEGNAASPKVLGLANVTGASTIIVAIPNAFEAGRAIEQCRQHNSAVAIIARAHSDEEERYLRQLGANTAIMGEREIALAMLHLVDADPRPAAEPMPAPAATTLPTRFEQVVPEPHDHDSPSELVREAVVDVEPSQVPAVEPPAAPKRHPARTPATPFNPEAPPKAG